VYERSRQHYKKYCIQQPALYWRQQCPKMKLPEYKIDEKYEKFKDKVTNKYLTH